MAQYPAALKTFTTKEDNVDIYAASHMNDVQDEIVAVQTELGTDVAGNAATLKARLAVGMSDAGGVQFGTSYPGTPVANQLFYRSDLDILYVRNAGNSSWQALGGDRSEPLFAFTIGGDYLVNSYGLSLDDSDAPAAATIMKLSWHVTGSTYRAIIKSKFKKSASVSTVTFYARTWADTLSGADDIAYCQINIGGQTGTAGSGESVTPAWQTAATIDVSSLNNGTVYDMTISLKNNSTNQSYLDSVIGFGS